LVTAVPSFRNLNPRYDRPVLVRNGVPAALLLWAKVLAGPIVVPGASALVADPETTYWFWAEPKKLRDVVPNGLISQPGTAAGLMPITPVTRLM
jgi:hypothetical protein